jgi:Glutamate racemase
MKRILKTLLFAGVALNVWGCHSRIPNQSSLDLLPIMRAALYDSCSFYFGDFGHYHKSDSEAPIGVFDSGTGGLTVMDAILTADMFNNVTGEEGADGLRDFEGEHFIYLADQANMPYGNYAAENKVDFLRELIVEDALFLMERKYYASVAASMVSADKEMVKSIVIACNTATATGLKDIEYMLEQSGTGLSVLGVVSAGARGALECLPKDASATIGVMATVGTIKTEGYERTLKQMAQNLGYTGDLQVLNQAAMGFAEAVDEEPDFVLRNLTAPRGNYRGPAIGHPEFPIKPDLLDVYNFDAENGALLIVQGHKVEIQLNAPQNYARYHLLSLVEQLRARPQSPPLEVLVMGCTHYPYYKETLQTMLQELRVYQKNGVYPYRDLIADEVFLIDPAVNTAKELYLLLRKQGLLAKNASPTSADFYITVPNTSLHGVGLDSPQRFSYEYKYGRPTGSGLEYVKTVPFSEENIDATTLARFRSSIPTTFSLIRAFN